MTTESEQRTLNSSFLTLPIPNRDLCLSIRRGLFIFVEIIEFRFLSTLTFVDAIGRNVSKTVASLIRDIHPMSRKKFERVITVRINLCVQRAKNSNTIVNLHNTPGGAAMVIEGSFVTSTDLNPV